MKEVSVVIIVLKVFKEKFESQRKQENMKQSGVSEFKTDWMSFGARTLEQT